MRLIREVVEESVFEESMFEESIFSLNFKCHSPSLCMHLTSVNSCAFISSQANLKIIITVRSLDVDHNQFNDFIFSLAGVESRDAYGESECEDFDIEPRTVLS
jgi:hypothetical protein